MKNFIRILRFEVALAGKSLLNVAGFSSTVIGTLAITLGALICVFNLNNLLLLKSLPYPDADSLLVLHQSYTEEGKQYEGAQSVPGMILWYKKQQVFSQLALIRDTHVLVASHPEQPTALVGFVTPEYFSLLKPAMAVGRVIGMDEGMDKHQPVAVLSYATWQNLFNGDNQIIGSKVQLGNTPYKIIGVTAKSFHAPANRNNEAIEFWLPWDYHGMNVNNWGVMTRALVGIGKLKPGVSQAQATALLGSMLNEPYLASGAAQAGDSAGAKLISLKAAIIGDSPKVALLLLCGVVALLLIATTNVTNLFLSRAAEKQRTMAIQAAMGAKPGHLFTAMFAESLLLCGIAGLLGLLVAGWGFVLLQELAAEQLPRIAELGLDGTTFAFTLVLVLVLAAVLAKLSSRVVDYDQLKSQLQSSGKGSGLQISARIRHMLIAIQVTLASLLLIGASVVIEQALSTVLHPLGFNEQNVSLLRIDRPKQYVGFSDDNLTALNLLTQEVKKQLLLLPQVEQVSRSLAPVITKGVFSMNLNDRDNNRIGSFSANMVDENYFDLLGLPLLQGRTFTPQKDPGYHISEIVLSESLARFLAPNGDALGKIYQLQADTPLKVIGIVQDYYHPGMTSDDSYRQYYLPFAAFSELNFDIKLKPGATLQRQTLLTLLHGIDPNIKIRLLTDYASEHEKLIYRHKLAAGLTIVLALLALLLAAAGIYGVLNYSTQMRRYELGIHLALGAKTQRLQRMVVKESLAPILYGVAASALLTVLIFMLLRQQVSTMLDVNIATVVSTVPVMLAIAYLACYLPVRKIISENPIKALRNE